MDKLLRKKLHFFLWTSIFLVSLICSACATGSNVVTPKSTHTSPSATSTPNRQQTANSLLKGPVIYVALGASDAVGVGSNSPGAQGYVPLLAAHLPKGSHLINLGISGIHLHEAISKELPLALMTSPNLITIWLVTNDFIGGITYDSYMHDLNTLLQRLDNGTHARIVMANLPDLTRLPAFANLSPTQKTQTVQAILRWNAGIAQLAAHYGVILVDLFSHGSELTAHPEYISADGFHPSPRGYVQLANLFWQAIKG